MSATDQAIEMLRLHEGFRSKPYLCPAGRLTVGYGRNLEDRGITIQEAEILLRNDVRDVENQLSMLHFWLALSDNRQAVLIDMAVNMGFTGLMKFHNMTAALMAGDYEKAADEMLNSAWAKQVPARSQELADIMRKG